MAPSRPLPRPSPDTTRMKDTRFPPWRKHGAEHQERRGRAVGRRARRTRAHVQDRGGAERPRGAPGRGARGERPRPGRAPPAAPRARRVALPARRAARNPRRTRRTRAHPRLRPGGRVIVDASALVAIVLREDGWERLLAALDAAGIAVLPYTHDHARLAAQAFRRFGRGRHPASLNFGDCISYAVADAASAPLLYVGDDF